MIKKFRSHIYDDDNDGAQDADNNDVDNNDADNNDVDNNDEKRIEWISTYLSHKNGTFDATLRPILNIRGSSLINFEDLREYAIIIHQLKCIELDQLLWNKYLQCGTGELIQQKDIQSVLPKNFTKLPHLKWWPKEIKLRMIQRNYTIGKEPDEVKYDECFNYVQCVLKKYEQQKIFYGNKFQTIYQRLKNSLNENIENTIVNFVLQYGINLYRIRIERSIVSTEYEYKDQLLQMEFSREHPNNYQREIFENLFELNRLKEEAQLNVALLKQRLVHKQLPRSFESLRLPTPIELESIRNKEIRRRLEEQAKKILERTQAEMMLVYMSATEVKLNELQKKFDQDMNIMKKI
jgi:hypothetical protein